MLMELPSYILKLLNSVASIKILGVYATDGTLELVPISLLKAPNADLILLPQMSDQAIQSLLTQIMEEGATVSLLCLEPQQGEKRAYQLACVVKEYQIAGPLYEKFIDELRVSYAGLQGVWILTPLSVKERY